MPVYLRDLGLFVSERVADSASVERALNAIDHPIAPRLFVIREVDRHYGCYVWRCLIDNGDQVPAEVCEWRDVAGRPLPLSHGFVEKVKRQIAVGNGDQVVAVLERAQEAHRERVRREIDETFQEIADDLGGRMRDTHSAVLHRGQHLRRSREKRLRSGEDARRGRIADRLRKLAE